MAAKWQPKSPLAESDLIPQSTRQQKCRGQTNSKILRLIQRGDLIQNAETRAEDANPHNAAVNGLRAEEQSREEQRCLQICQRWES